MSGKFQVDLAGAGGTAPGIADAPVSDRIRARLERAGRRFHANDNIHDCIEPGELEILQQEVAARMRTVLEALVIDMPVEVVFEVFSDEITLPFFQPVSDGTAS